MEERFASRVTMNVPDRHNPRLHRVMDLVNQDDDLYALWLAANVNAVERLGMTDHGPVHVKIVMNIAVRMLRLLSDAGVEPSVTTHYGFPPEDAEVVVALAALLHDVGMSIHRTGHEEFSLFIAKGKLDEMLPQVYDRRASTIMRSEVLHAIIAHRSGGIPLTLEAGIVRIADALDMAKGRSRIPFSAGSLSIHSISGAGHRGRDHRERRGATHPVDRRNVQLSRRIPAGPTVPREAQWEWDRGIRGSRGKDGRRNGEAALPAVQALAAR